MKRNISMKIITRIHLIKLAFSRKYDHIYWFTFQLKDQQDNGQFETFVQSYHEGKILNTPEIIKGHVQKEIDNREK